MNNILEMLLSNPDAASKSIDVMANTYKPLIYKIIAVLWDFYKDYAKNDEYFSTVASASYNMFKAYVDAGFTEDQAMMLMLNSKISLENFLNKSNASVKVKK